MRVILLSPNEVTLYWMLIKDMLIGALEKSKWIDRYPIQALYDDLIESDKKCWLVVTYEKIIAVAVTQDVDYPLGKSLLVFQLFGDDMETWYSLLNENFDKYSRDLGIKWIDACAREGLGKKYLSRIGYKVLNHHYCKKVD